MMNRDWRLALTTTIVLIVLSISIVITACAESKASTFDMRNDIHFGDSIDEVVNKSNISGYSEREDGDVVYYQADDTYTIAGIDGVRQRFYLDDNDGLKCLMFYLGDGSNRTRAVPYTRVEELRPIYESLAKRLTDKYGQPLTSYETGTDNLIGNVLQDALINSTEDAINSAPGHGAYDLSDINTFISNATEWIISLDDGGMVKIELVLWGYNYHASLKPEEAANLSEWAKSFASGYDYDFSRLAWGYTYFDAATVERMEEYEQAINDDL